jgi:Ca2+-binding EF-hand superfamily protein
LGLDEFFSNLMKYPRSPITDAIPQFMDTKSEAMINFGEFVDIICTIAHFEQMDLLRFMFYILDPQRVGLIEKHELKHFFITIWRHQPYTSLDDAMKYLENNDEDGSYTFPEIARLRTLYPNIFYPLYQLQQHIIAHSLGEDWWSKHKADLTDELALRKEKEANMLLKEKRDREKALETVSDDMIRRKMGIKYYLMPWTIDRERKRLTRIAAIEQDLEHQFAEMKRDSM